MYDSIQGHVREAHRKVSDVHPGVSWCLRCARVYDGTDHLRQWVEHGLRWRAGLKPLLKVEVVLSSRNDSAP